MYDIIILYIVLNNLLPTSNGYWVEHSHPSIKYTTPSPHTNPQHDNLWYRGS